MALSYFVKTDKVINKRAHDEAVANMPKGSGRGKPIAGSSISANYAATLNQSYIYQRFPLIKKQKVT